MHDKIDIYIKAPCHNKRGFTWAYVASTNMSKTCRDAKTRYCEKMLIHPDSVKAVKAK